MIDLRSLGLQRSLERSPAELAAITGEIAQGVSSRLPLATLGDLVYPPLPMSDPLPADALPELLTVDEVAELLRVTPSAVRERAKRGAIPGAVEGVKPRRFRAHEVRCWLGLPVPKTA